VKNPKNPRENAILFHQNTVFGSLLQRSIRPPKKPWAPSVRNHECLTQSLHRTRAPRSLSFKPSPPNFQRTDGRKHLPYKYTNASRADKYSCENLGILRTFCELDTWFFEKQRRPERAEQSVELLCADYPRRSSGTKCERTQSAALPELRLGSSFPGSKVFRSALSGLRQLRQPGEVCPVSSTHSPGMTAATPCWVQSCPTLLRRGLRESECRVT
jgi:hypothetical protein